MSGERKWLLRSKSSLSERDLESQRQRFLSNRSDRSRRPNVERPEYDLYGGGGGNDKTPPEWALLVLGCLLGLATGLCVAAFNRGVHVIHEWVWAGTPNEGASWLRLQSLADTWHQILLIPLFGGVIVGLLHRLLEILSQMKHSNHTQALHLLAPVFPVIKAVQAAVTLGTGCSLGPEGPSVDIGKSCANGCSVMMDNNRERKIALVAAGAAAGIASGFNAAVAGCFFAIETVLKPLRAENSPPFTTAMIILASVVSSTVSNAILGEKQAFTVPTTTVVPDTGYRMRACECPVHSFGGLVRCGIRDYQGKAWYSCYCMSRFGGFRSRNNSS